MNRKQLKNHNRRLRVSYYNKLNAAVIKANNIGLYLEHYIDNYYNIGYHYYLKRAVPNGEIIAKGTINDLTPIIDQYCKLKAFL